MPSLVGVVINPAAAGGRARGIGERVLAGLRGAGVPVENLSARTGELALKRAQEAAETLSRLVVVGGDGVVHLGVNAVAGTPVPLGIVACGSGNDLARALGLPVHQVEASLKVVIDGVARAPRVVDAMRVSHGLGQEWTLGVVSVGIDAAVNARANGYRWPGGTARYVRALAGELGRFRPYGYRVVVDGVAREFAGTLVAVANTSMIGGGMRIAPQARIDDGLLDVVIAAEVTRGQLLRVFPRVYGGTHLSHPAVSLVRGRQVRIEHLASGPMPPEAYGDGERLGPVPMTVEVVPGAVRVIGSGQ